MELNISNPAYLKAGMPAWFCVRAKPKQEHLATMHLRQVDGIDVFAPRIRFKKPRGNRQIWMTEALFPGYLFAKFDFVPLHRLVQLTPGVSTIVRFGDRYAQVEEEIVVALRDAVGREEIREMGPRPLRPGEIVAIGAGPLRGLEAVVIEYKPARERVRVLLEMLGREVVAEVALRELQVHGDRRCEVFAPGG